MAVYVVLYLVPALAGCVATLMEYRTKGDLSPVHAAMGVLACLVWPLTLLAMLAYSRLQGARLRRIALPA